MSAIMLVVFVFSIPSKKKRRRFDGKKKTKAKRLDKNEKMRKNPNEANVISKVKSIKNG